ncbi:hypothetical protein [Phormidium nigroviride]
MFGNYQQSHLRIEVNASESEIRDSLLRPSQLQEWLWPQQFSSGMPEQLYQGLAFTSWVGPVALEHKVEIAESNCLRLLLSQGIDGFHEWYWGDGWVQSRLEGVSAMPLSLGQTVSLLRLREFLKKGKGE